MFIFQIYHDKTQIPYYVANHIQKLNPNCVYKLIDFNEGKNIIRENFIYKDMIDRILYCIDNYPRYCHKSDLLRYCLLYIYGGIYLDVDLKPMIPFSEMVSKDIDFLTSFGRAGEPFTINNTMVYPVTSNGIIMSKKNNPIFIDLIKNAINNEKLMSKNTDVRGENVFYLYNYLNEKCKQHKKMLEPFKKIELDINLYLLNHILKANFDCIVDNNKILVMANDKKYIFNRQPSILI